MFVDGALGGRGGEDLGALDNTGLIAAFQAADRERRRVEARLAAIAAEVDRRQVYRDDGHTTAAGWVRAVGRWSPTDATTVVRLGRLAVAAPDVRRALTDAALGVAQARVLAEAYANPRCGDQLVDVLDLLLVQAAKLEYVGFKTVVDRWEQLADADGAHRAAETSHVRRRASVHVVAEQLHVRADGPAAQGAAMGEIFERFCEAEYLADWDAARHRRGDAATPGDLERTHAQRAFDALYAIFVRAAATPPDHPDPEPLLNLLIDQGTVLHHLDAAGSKSASDPEFTRHTRCETTTGTVLAPADALAAMIAGQVRRVVVDPAGVIINLGRRRRLFTGRARDAVLLQAARCCWPGCLRPAGRCQADHSTAWLDGGPTDASNGGPACGHHNRWKTRGYRTWRDADGQWHTYRPDGTEIP